MTWNDLKCYEMNDLNLFLLVSSCECTFLIPSGNQTLRNRHPLQSLCIHGYKSDVMIEELRGKSMGFWRELVVVLCKYQNRLLKNMGNGNNKMVIKISEYANSSVFFFVFVYFFKCVCVARNQEQKSRCQAPQFDKALCSSSIVLAFIKLPT